MESVEELCDHIALINKSVKIVDGPTDEIRNRYKSNTFQIRYKGDFSQVDGSLGSRFKNLEQTESEKENSMKIQYLNNGSNNELLQAMLPLAEIISFEEIIPAMNDVFIHAVQESNKKNKNE